MTKQLTKSIELTLATKNPGKLKEFEAMASNLATEQPLNLLWHMAPDDFDPEETGDTFTANAVIKAARAAEMTGRLSLADDSGTDCGCHGRQTWHLQCALLCWH